MCTVLLPQGVNPISDNKHIDINIYINRLYINYQLDALIIIYS